MSEAISIESLMGTLENFQFIYLSRIEVTCNGGVRHSSHLPVQMFDFKSFVKLLNVY